MKPSRSKVHRLDDGRVVVYPGRLGPFFSHAPFGLELLTDRPDSLPTGKAYVATRADFEVTDATLEATLAQWHEALRYVKVFLLRDGVELHSFDRKLWAKQLSAPNHGDVISVPTPPGVQDHEAVEYVVRSITELGYVPTLLVSAAGTDVAVVVRPTQ